MTRDATALVRLLQLASPALPVGAYSYSQGLEPAAEAGIVCDAQSCERWIGDVMDLCVCAMEVPILWRLVQAWGNADLPAAERWNAQFIASRESAELRAETVQMGYSLRKLVKELGLANSRALEGFSEIAFPTVFAFSACAWDIDGRDALAAYLWAWIENQVLAAVKAVPLGQTDGQRLLLRLGARIPAAVQSATELADEDLANFAPGLALLSARHETQYTRIFRS